MNVQGNLDIGRGADGLNGLKPAYVGSRLGPGVPSAPRPAHLRRGRYKTAAQAQPITPRRVTRQELTRNRQQFINWLKRWAPRVYTYAKEAADREQARDGALNGLSGWFDSFMDKLTDAGGKYLQLRTQKDILDAQMERMRAGLPPLQTSEYAPTVKVQPDPATTKQITGAIGAGFQGALPWVIGAGGLLLLMGRKR